MNRKNAILFCCIFLVTIWSTACRAPNSISFASVEIPPTHTPDTIITTLNLDQYTLVYCWRPLEQEENVAANDRRTDLIVSNGNGSIISVLSHPGAINGAYKLGCLSDNEQNFRYGYQSLAWRPEHEQLAAVSTAALNFPLLRVIAYDRDLTFDLPGELYKSYGEPSPTFSPFSYPEYYSWSSDGRRFAARADDGEGSVGSNIWVLDLYTNETIKVTEVPGVGKYVLHSNWSPDDSKLVIGYGDFEESGIGIYTFDNEEFIEVSSASFPELVEWPHTLHTIKDVISIFIDSSKFNFQKYLLNYSQPQWFDTGSRIVFLAPTKNSRVTLFVVNNDGTQLEEVFPDLPGLVASPTISPSGEKIAFARYPGWDSLGRAEIAVADLDTLEILSLVVLPDPGNGEQLFISGISWTPDGKYLAFSSNHEGRSNIYIISVDGQSWLNLTNDLEGDAVNPVWKP